MESTQYNATKTAPLCTFCACANDIIWSKIRLSRPTNSHYPLPHNGKDVLLIKAQFARKGNILSGSSHDVHVYSTKQFWKQNLVTSTFLVKCLLLTASFLGSRKQYESFTLKTSSSLSSASRKVGFYKSSYVTSHVKHTPSPLPHPETIRIYFNPLLPPPI